jgi:biotin carboxylase
VNRPRLLLLLPTATYRSAAFVEAARRLDIALTVASEHPSTFEPARPDALLTLDIASVVRSVDQALAFHRDSPVAAALGVDDDTVILATAINHAIGRPANPLPAVEAARDKFLQRGALRASGVPVPDFALHDLMLDPSSLAAGATYPCVLKPLRLAASRGVIRADDAAQFTAAFARIRRLLDGADVPDCGPAGRQVLVEAFVPGVEVALEGLLDKGRLHVLALFDKPDPLDGPFFEETIYVTPSRLPEDAQHALADVAEDAAHAIGLTDGPVHAELRWNARGAWLIELAARPIGGRCSAAIRFGTDVTLEEVVLRHALGLPLPSLAREARAAGVMMIPVPGQGGVVRGVKGVDRARAVPGVDDVVITATGQKLVPWPEGSRYPGFIFARGARPEDVELALRAAHRQLEWELEPVD